MNEIMADMQKLANPAKAQILSGFFKTGKGQYGEGDIFLGITVPVSRSIAKKYIDAALETIAELLKSRIHEHRLVALLILVEKYQKAKDQAEKKEIFDFYFANNDNINNWDLVDLSADKIAGEHLFEEDKAVLYKLAKSENLWHRRIAIISTFNFIKKGKFEDTFAIAEILMKDRHDLIHKAVGWMLREVGKRNQQAEEEFLMKHYRKMPRTMLRYAIERLSEDKRKFYMKRGPRIHNI